MSLLHILQPQQEMGACSLLWMLIHQARGSYENHITHLSGHNHEQVLNRNVIWYNIEDGRTNTRILHYNCIGEKKIIMNSGENTMPAPKINIIHGEKPV